MFQIQFRTTKGTQPKLWLSPDFRTKFNHTCHFSVVFVGWFRCKLAKPNKTFALVSFCTCFLRGSAMLLISSRPSFPHSNMVHNKQIKQSVNRQIYYSWKGWNSGDRERGGKNQQNTNRVHKYHRVQEPTVMGRVEFFAAGED